MYMIPKRVADQLGVDSGLLQQLNETAPPLWGRTCPECSDYFTTTNPDRNYCSDDCRNGDPLT